MGAVAPTRAVFAPRFPGMPTHSDLQTVIVFPVAKVAVLVDGCFWHASPEPGYPQSPGSTTLRTRWR